MYYSPEDPRNPNPGFDYVGYDQKAIDAMFDAREDEEFDFVDEGDTMLDSFYEEIQERDLNLNAQKASIPHQMALLMMLTGNYDLYEDIENNEVSRDDLKATLRNALVNLAEHPNVFVERFMDNKTLLAVDQKLAMSVGNIQESLDSLST